MPPVLYRLAHGVRRRVFRLLNRHTRGAKVIAVNAAGEVLLVRNSYGRRHLWVLPGGAIGRGEEPAAAAARELREETGLTAGALLPLGTFETTEEGWRDTVHVFTTTCSGAPHGDGGEIAALGFFAPDALPANASDATQRRIAEWRGERGVTGVW